MVKLAQNLAMASRRKFLRHSVIGSAAFMAGKDLLAVSANTKIGSVNKPVVLSTWSFGKEANAGAWETLGKGGRALDAVEKGVMVAEADPKNHSVGYSGLPDRDGRVTLDACIMDENFNCGSVMFLEHIVHPISVARMVMEKTPHIQMAGQGALAFALANGFEKKNLLTPEAEKIWRDWLKTADYAPQVNIEEKLFEISKDPLPGGPDNHDTIGMIALDASGNLSGACTTSGLAYKRHGRVGDSPIIGAGLYVDNEVGAATATGVGEEVIRIAGAHLIVELMRQGASPEAACKQAIERIVRIRPEKAKQIQVAFLALNKKGEYGAYCLRQGFSYAVRTGSEETIYKAKSVY